jgi:hypothetical protein
MGGFNQDLADTLAKANPLDKQQTTVGVGILSATLKAID